MKIRHFHIITVVEYTAKYMILLIVPLLRALVFTNIGLLEWLKWAWIDVLVILTILGAGIIRYFISGYVLQAKGLLVKSGLLWRKQIFVPYNKIGIYFVQAPLISRLMWARNIYIDTDAGDKKSSDIKFCVRAKEVIDIDNRILSAISSHGKIKSVYESKKWEVAILSLVFSNTFAGVVFTATFITFLGKLIGQDLNTQVLSNATKIADTLALKIPPIASVTAYVLIAGWTISFLLNIFRNFNFIAIRSGKKLSITSGVFIKRKFIINVRRVNYVKITQSVLTKFLGLYSGFIACNGYGKQKNEYPVIIPNGKKKDVQAEVKMLFPTTEIAFSQRQMKPLKPFLFRFVILPINMILITTLGLVLALYKFKQFSDTIWFIGIMIMLPCIWFLVVKIVAFFHTGIGRNGDTFSLRFTDTFKIYTILIPKDKIVKVEFSQTLLQKSNDGCDLKIYPFSESRKPIIVTNMLKKQAKELFL